MSTNTEYVATVTRAEAASMLGVSVRTIARMVNRGDLETAFTATGVRRITRASVTTRRETAKVAPSEAPKADTVSVTEYARLAAAFGALAQSVDTYLAAGFLARRSARSALTAARAADTSRLLPESAPIRLPMLAPALNAKRSETP